MQPRPERCSGLYTLAQRGAGGADRSGAEFRSRITCLAPWDSQLTEPRRYVIVRTGRAEKKQRRENQTVTRRHTDQLTKLQEAWAVHPIAVHSGRLTRFFSLLDTSSRHRTATAWATDPELRDGSPYSPYAKPLWPCSVCRCAASARRTYCSATIYSSGSTCAAPHYNSGAPDSGLWIILASSCGRGDHREPICEYAARGICAM